MSEKANILGRIREALTLAAPLPGAHDVHDHSHAPNPAPIVQGQVTKWLPPVGSDRGSQIALFTKNSVELKTNFQIFPNEDALRQALIALAREENWQRVGSHRGELTDEACISLSLPVCYTDERYAAHDLERCDVGITQCEALIAQTGSVLVTTRSSGGRALSVLPPHHLVLARLDQMLPDLPGAFALLKEKYAHDYPSFTSFITGPSRTGDIERILVLGAHGPKKLTIFCLES